MTILYTRNLPTNKWSAFYACAPLQSNPPVPRNGQMGSCLLAGIRVIHVGGDPPSAEILVLRDELRNVLVFKSILQLSF